jgi:hypothetical protein
MHGIIKWIVLPSYTLILNYQDVLMGLDFADFYHLDRKLSTQAESKSAFVFAVNLNIEGIFINAHVQNIRTAADLTILNIGLLSARTQVNKR